VLAHADAAHFAVLAEERRQACAASTASNDRPAACHLHCTRTVERRIHGER
jgi:hypothetical protein